MLGGRASVNVEKKKGQNKFCGTHISPIVLDAVFKVDHSNLEAAVSGG